MNKVSVIYSSLNELQNPFFSEIAKLPSQAQAACEYIAVDGASTDATADTLRAGGWTVEDLPASNRAQRYNRGLAKATGDVVLLQHPRSILSAEAYVALTKVQPKSWGAFTHCFDKSGAGYKFTSWYSNHVRGRFFSIYYLDHCIFVDRELLLSIGGVPTLDVFEDTRLCEKLRAQSLPLRLPHLSKTSSIRFERNGFVKQAIKNQWLKLKYHLNTDHHDMYKTYEKGLDLNGQKED